jgi:hypothetical protein
MRFLRETIAVAAAVSAFGVVQAAIGARELEHVAPTTQLPTLPLSSRLAALGLVLMLVAYLALGRLIARRGAGATTAGLAGAAAGAIAGVVSGVAQATLQSDFLRDVLLWSSLPDAYLGLLVGAVLVLEPLFGAVFAAVATWLGYVFFRPARRRENAA